MRVAWCVLVLAFLLSGCPDCGPGWTFTWSEEPGASMPAGAAWDEPRGAEVNVPGVDAPVSFWHADVVVEGVPVGVVAPRDGAMHTLYAVAEGRPEAQRAFEEVLRAMGADDAGAVAEELEVWHNCVDNPECDEGDSSWRVATDHDLLPPPAWFADGVASHPRLGVVVWDGPIEMSFLAATWEARGPGVVVRGNALGQVDASAYFSSGSADKMSEDEARAAIDAALGVRVPPDAHAAAGDCYI